MIVEVETGQVISYTANSTNPNLPFYHVDIIRSERSTGSLLKSVLYASLLDNGELLPQQFIKDTPVRFDNYAPQNFTKDFQGAVPADLFIQKSLNVPAVRLFKDYGIDRFMNKLQQLSLNSIDKSADYYGLPLILGGAESSLWELTRMYTYLTRQLRFYNNSKALPFKPNLNILNDNKTEKSSVSA